MSKIVWDRAGEHFYETGVDHGVLYPTKGGVYGVGVPWNGLTSVSESPSGADSNAQYADNIKYLNLISAEEFGATIEAFTYPEEFEVCDGSAAPVPGVIIGQQNRRPFGLSYRTLIGNDLEGTEYGYKIHLIYGATASPSSRDYGTVNDSPEAITFSWEVTTTPVEVSGYKPTASLVVDSTKTSASNMAKLERILYGSDTAEPRLPMPDEVIKLLGSSSAISLTVTAPEGMTEVLGKTVSELQSNIDVNAVDSEITGKLNYIKNYTEFSETMGDQEGNYLALNVSADVSDANITVELLSGKSTDVKMTEDDKIAVIRVTNGDTQVVKVTATKDRDTVSEMYSLKKLQLVGADALG